MLRFDPPGCGKEFAPAIFCENTATGARQWRFKGWPPPRPLYGLDRLALRPNSPVVVCEGEKAADAAAELLPDHVAVASPNGAESAAKADWRALAGRNVTLWPDNDDGGRAYAQAVARLLGGVAASVKIASIPDGAGQKWDAANALAEGWDRRAAAALIASALPASENDPPRDSVDDDAEFAAEIARLAVLPPLQIARRRIPAAKRFRVRVSVLDQVIRAERSKGSNGNGQGRPLDLRDPEPWPDPVPGAALLDEISGTTRQYVIVSELQAEAIALWVVFTHAFDAFHFSPKLLIRSVVKRSGKTRLVEVLERMVRRPLFVSGTSAAALLRVIDQHAPSMLLDEIDTMMKGGDAEMREALRGLINSGFNRSGARFIKNVPTPCGGYEPAAFSTWCPMLLAGIGDVPDTVADRSIPIEMQRKRPDERVKGLRDDDGRELWDLGRKSTRWVADNLDGLRRARPPTPGQLHDRAADAWSPLLAIADTAGGDWPERARRASLTLARDGADGAETALTRLLADIKAAFDAKATDRLASEDIIAYLVGLDDRPWPEFRAGKPITKAQLARLLRPLRILSGTIRLEDGRTPKGYYRRAFEDAFARYRPPEQNATTPQTRDSAGCSENQTATNGDGVAFGNREKPEDAADCGGVADRAGEDALCDFLERAGILEYDGGFSRADAERLAWAEIAARPPPMN